MALYISLAFDSFLNLNNLKETSSKLNLKINEKERKKDGERKYGAYCILCEIKRMLRHFAAGAFKKIKSAILKNALNYQVCR